MSCERRKPFISESFSVDIAEAKEYDAAFMLLP